MKQARSWRFDRERNTPKRVRDKNFSRRWVIRYLVHAQNVALPEATREILTILQEQEANSFDGIITEDKFSWQCVSALSKVFALSPSDVLARMG
jgi:glutamate mutase epsilon subunit